MAVQWLTNTPCFPLQGAQVPSLAGKLRSHMLAMALSEKSKNRQTHKQKTKYHSNCFLYSKEWACAKVTIMQLCLIKPDIFYTFTNTPVMGETEKHLNSVCRANLLCMELRTKKIKGFHFQ